MKRLTGSAVESSAARAGCILLADHARRVVILTVWALAFAQMASADPIIMYVTTNGTGLGTSWADATNNLQGAIDVIDAGNPTNTVWVSNGVYEVGGLTNYPAGTVLTNRVAIWKAITVRSANNDPTNTIIKGTGPIGTTAIRCVYMTNSSTLIGFMLTNGATLALNYPESGTNDNHSGGGVYCQGSSAIISNCMITGNSAAYFGGGAITGTLYNCALIGNSVSSYRGGGTAYNTLSNCTLVGNTASVGGGGAYSAYLYNCSLISNSAGSYGGGVMYSSLYNCSLIGNATTSSKGGAVYNYSQYVCNCLIIGNKAGSSGGGVAGGIVENCTIVGNYAGIAGGGASYATTNYGKLYNCIVYFNDAPSDPNYYDILSTNYCCTTPLPGIGSGNISNDPMFVANGSDYGTNHVAGNYRLTANSPCVNTGTNGSWTTTAPYDLDGRARIRYGTVDMGAYEKIYEGTIYSFH